jgi:hypothetical protein
LDAKSLTKPQLEEILYAYLSDSQRRAGKAKEAYIVGLLSEVGSATSEDTFAGLDLALMQIELNKYTARQMAARLLEMHTDVPLVSPDEYFEYFEVYLSEKFEDMDEMNAQTAMTLFRSFAKGQIDDLLKLGKKDKNEYEVFWDRIKNTLAIAEEYNIEPKEVFSNDLANDELTRRSYTKEEYLELAKQAIETVTNIDLYMDKILEPMFILLGDGEAIEEDLKAEVKEDLSKRLLVQLLVMGENLKNWYEGEIKRIYG